MTSETAAPPAVERRPARPARLREAGTLAWVLPVLVYVVLSLGGITTANIGADSLRADPDNPTGIELGAAQDIRGDEYRTDSPIALGWITTGGNGIDNPLNISHNIFHQLPSGPVSSVTFFDGTIARLGPWLPDAMLFAAKWWLPTLLLFVGMPAWFRILTGHRRWGYLAAGLIFFSPTNAWWSGWPVNTLGFLSASMALLLIAHKLFVADKRVAGVAVGLLSGVLMARYPTYYQPYAIILGLPLLGATAAYLLLQDGRLRPKLTALAVAGGSGAVLAAGTMLESLEPIRVGLDTVYPGQRVNTGLHLPFGKVFGATNLTTLQSDQHGLVSTNASEVSSAFIVLFLVAVLVRLAGPWTGSRPLHAAWCVVAGFTAFWLVWCTVDLGSFGEHLPLANMVPALRAANAVGFLGILAFCLVMSQWDAGRASARRTAAGAAVLTGVVSVYAGESLRDGMIPLLSTAAILVSGAVAAAVVYALVRWPARPASMVAVLLAAAAVTGTVNPVLIGLADLRGSSTARLMIREGEQAREDRTLWATDTPEFDSLLFATGTPSLTSRQQLGPDEDEWLKFDPGGLHRDLWNRGGTYPHFRWTTDDGIQWSGAGLNHVILKLSPCTAARIEPRLEHIVSGRRLDLPCLELERTVRWSGYRQFVYAVG